jgi:phage tail-like protein
MSETGRRVDPYGSYSFLIEIDGIARGAFMEASGFESAIDIIEYSEGGDNQTPRKLAARTKYANIVLKWGVTDDPELWIWHRQWVTGDPAAARRSGSIIQLDRRGDEKVRWNFYDAWPVKWTGPTFTAESTEASVETLEIAHEGIERVV